MDPWAVSKYDASQTCTSMWCTGLSGAQASAPDEQAALRKNPVLCGCNSPDCPVNPWPTVDFTTEGTTVDCHLDCQRSEGQKWSEKAGRTGLSGVPPDCPVYHKGMRIQQSTATDVNGRVTWQVPNNEQCCVRCAPKAVEGSLLGMTQTQGHIDSSTSPLD
jgi:hypothetical protein